MDQAGWHVSKSLAVPDSITILLLPPYSPELNPIEGPWGCLKRSALNNHYFGGIESSTRAIHDDFAELQQQHPEAPLAGLRRGS